MTTVVFTSRRAQMDKIIITVFLFLILVLRFYLVPEQSTLYNSIYFVWSILIFLYSILSIINIKGQLRRIHEQVGSMANMVILGGTICALSIVVIHNFYVHGFNSLGFLNFRRTIDAFWAFPFFYKLSICYDSDRMRGLFIYTARILNFYFWFNFFIILFEFLTGGSFLVERFLQYNPAVYDSTTGLIGLSGTPIMMLYWVVLIFTNLVLIVNRDTYRSSRIVNFILELLFMCIIAEFFSEMKSFFVTIPITFGMLFVLQLKKRVSKRAIFVLTIIITLIAGATAVTYYVSNSARVLVEKYAMLIGQILSGTGQGSDIRVKTLWLASTSLKNMGFSNIDFSTQTYAAQLSVISLNVLLVYGGVSLAILMMFLISHSLVMVTKVNTRGGLILAELVMFLFILYLCLITLPFQDPREMFFVYYFGFILHVLIINDKYKRQIQ